MNFPRSTQRAAVVTPASRLLDPRRVSRAKAAYTTRFLSRLIAKDPTGYGLLSGEGVVPRAGDVLLARVEEIGQHPRIELPMGRRAILHEGDELLLAYGNRYAPDQFEGEVPQDLGLTSLLAAGGVAGRVLSCHGAMLPATTLRPIGLLTDSRGVVTLKRCAPFVVDAAPNRCAHALPVTIAVLGTSMNSGKTTAVASIVRGLSAFGLVVAAGKGTGTGAGGDPGLFIDSGASRVLDFTDFGCASTYRLPHDEIRGLFSSLHARLATYHPDVIVLEIADGLYQQETSRLVADPVFGHLIDAIVFTAGEVMGAVAGTASLREQLLPVAAVSGVLTMSPLAMGEARAVLDVPVLDARQLSDPNVAHTLLPDRLTIALQESDCDERDAV